MSSIPLISMDTLEILIILVGTFAFGFWGHSIFAKQLPIVDTQKSKSLEEQIENLNTRIGSANRSIVEYVSRESELKRKIELLEAQDEKKIITAPPLIDDNLQDKIVILEDEIKLNQFNLELAAKIIDQLRDENDRNRILPNHMESYMAALTEANSQILLYKRQLEDCQNNLAQAEQIISQLQDKLTSKTTEQVV